MMFFNINHNNYKYDKLVDLQVRNMFRVSGYWAYYIIKSERGIDYTLQEMYDNQMSKGFFLPLVVQDFNFETSSIFSKFGITIPNILTFLIRREDIEAQRALLNPSTSLDDLSFPEEGDLIFLPLQNQHFKGQQYTSFNASAVKSIPQSQLAEWIQSGPETMNYLFEITNIGYKEYTFNGKSWVFKMTCKVYEKKQSVTVGSDPSVAPLAANINMNPAPQPNLDNPTQNLQNAPIYKDEVFKDEFNNIVSYDKQV